MIDCTTILHLNKKEIQDFIKVNFSNNITNLALLKNPFPELDYKIILNQIESRGKCKQKLPTWFSTENIIYPSKTSIEQTSSEIVAGYKSEIVSGENLIDLSAGFGVDSYYFSKKVSKVFHCEIDSNLSEIVRHNFKLLNAQNIECLSGDSQEILKKIAQQFTWIYIDPSRRNEQKNRVYKLNDCLPDVTQLQDLYLNYSNNLLIKTAPILDLKAGLVDLKFVKNIHIVSVLNEVKEILWEIEKNYAEKITIKTIDFKKTTIDRFDFVYDSKQNASFSLPKKYLYEPNSAIMKSGGFNEIGNYFSLEKLHISSHLYTSAEYCSDFPGRVFEIEKIIKYSKSEIKENILNKKANITTRNFPESVDEIKKKWNIKDGGVHFYFFTTNSNNEKIVILCQKK